ncbi:MAG: hypothetical protein ACRBFS_11965 [Aureispira sp.]
MKKIKSIQLEQLENSSTYKLIEEGIYSDWREERDYASYRFPITMELEDGENSQYPLEDILDKYLVHVEEFLDSKETTVLRFVLGGDLNNLQDLKAILGKRVYNQNYVDEEGQTRVKLVIE